MPLDGQYKKWSSPLLKHSRVGISSFVARVRQLYEREPGEGVSARLGAYVRRWVRWVTAGVAAVDSLLPRLGAAGPEPPTPSTPRGLLPPACSRPAAAR